MTGELTARPLADTVSSVAVMTADTIDGHAAVDRVDQLLAFVPNVQLGSGSQGPTIRGQDTTGVLQNLPAFLGGARPRATVEIDGRALGFSEYVFGVSGVWDVAQVEIFRSPQTTTQGPNSIAGAIFIHTNEPSYEWSAAARVLAGNYDTTQGSVALTGPLVTDQLAVRLAADLRRSRPSSEIADRTRGADPNRDDFGLVRLKLLAEPEALPGARLLATYVHQRSEAPQIVGVRTPFRERSDPVDGYGVFGISVDTLTGVLRYAVAPALVSTTTLSYGHASIRRYASPGLGEARSRNQDFTIESLVSWQPGGRWRMVAGFRHLDADFDQSIDVTALIGNGDFTDRQQSLGVFGEANWDLAPALTVTGGFRYERDSQRRRGAIAAIPLNYRKSFDAALPKVALTWKITEGVTGGILVQRGFNPGGTTIDIATGAQDEFGPETLWNHELFARATLAGGRLLLSTNVFFNAMKDTQLPEVRVVAVPGGSDLIVAEIDNAPRARAYGLEFDADWRPSPRLSVRAALGALDTRIVETIEPTDPVRGKQLQRSPHVSASAGVDWRPAERWRLSAQVRHHSGYFSDDANAPELRIRPATVIDGRAEHTLGAVTLFGYVRNALNTFYLTNLFDSTYGEAGDPREAGVGIEARF